MDVIPSSLMQAVMQYAGQPDDQSAQPGQTPNRLLRAVKSAAAAPPEEKHPDHTEPDPASRTASGAATLPSGGPLPEERPMHDRLSELESQYDRASQPIAQPDTKHRLLNFAIEAAPAALAPIAGRHGNYGAAEGVAKGVEGGVVRNQNLAENELNRATGVQQQNKNRLMQAMENESRLRTTERGQDTRAELADRGLTERARLQKEAEDARWKGLTANIQGRQQVADTNQQGQTTRQNQKLAQNMDQFRSTDAYRHWKENQDNRTKEDLANKRLAVTQQGQERTQDKAPAAMMQSAVFAQGGLSTLNDARAAMDRLQQAGVMGSLPANTIEDWIFGKGLVDPTLPPAVRNDIGKLRSAMQLTSSATMRAHTGRSSREIYNDFKQSLSPGQDWDALKGAMEETGGILTQYANAASDANIHAIRGGTNVPARPGGGGAGATDTTPRPPGVPPGYVHKNGPNGMGWYKPLATKATEAPAQ
jgi:hypothetical protein